MLSLLALLSLSAMAQDEDVGFTADRPGATTGVDILPKGRVQWETGMEFERIKVGESAFDSWTFNTSLFRWGIADGAELRLQTDYLYSIIGDVHLKGFSNVGVGTKVRIFEGWKAVPAISALSTVFIPGSSKFDFMLSKWSGQMGLLLQNELTSWCSLGYEADVLWYSGVKPTYFWGFCLSFQVSDRFSLMVEESNKQFYGLHENWMEFGAAYQLMPRLQLDLSGDLNLNNPRNYIEIMFGVAWQINKR